MKKDKLKGFVCGFLISTLIFSSVAVGFAATGSKSITAAYNNIKIYVNQKLITPKDAAGNVVEPFIYDGTTYLPVRAIAEALGQEVSWDDATKSVYIGSQPAAVSPPNASYTRSNPAPIGTSQSVTVDNYIEKYNATVTVNSILRGNEAWTKIKAANMFNSAAKDGYEYILASVTITANSVEDDAAISVSNYDFQAFSSNNEEYDIPSIVSPAPSLSGQIYAGGSQTGYVVFAVKTTDTTPKIVYGSNYNGTGGIWFNLAK